MKIRPLTETLQSFQRVSEKSDKDGLAQERQEQSRDQKRRQQDREITPTFGEVASAIETFAGDRQARESGLTASMEGQGPGLRVLLRDGSGAVIRQMTGEEFVRLRETVGQDPQARGKILDEKL